MSTPSDEIKCDAALKPLSKREAKKHTAIKSQPQRQKFIEAARELGCDEDEAAFGAALKKIGSAKPSASEKKPAK